jgi:hypothetical protein
MSCLLEEEIFAAGALSFSHSGLDFITII